METSLLQVTVQKWPDFMEPDGAKVSFAVRLPHEAYIQTFNLSTLEYRELLDRCWEITRDKILEHFKEQKPATKSL